MKRKSFCNNNNDNDNNNNNNNNNDNNIIIIIMSIQCDHVIEAKRPDMVVVEKENNKAIIVNIASPWDHRLYENKGEEN